MSGKEYVESLASMKTLVYIDGEPVREFWTHPAIRPAVNALATTYDLASNPGLNPEVHKFIVADSDLTAGKINRFLNIVQSQEDLSDPHEATKDDDAQYRWLFWRPLRCRSGDQCPVVRDLRARQS